MIFQGISRLPVSRGAHLDVTLGECVLAGAGISTSESNVLELRILPASRARAADPPRP